MFSFNPKIPPKIQQMKTKASVILVIAALLPLFLRAQNSDSIPRKHGHDVYVAASDSHQADKDAADVVCTGTGDQDALQRAIAAVSSGGTVHLAAGNYYIDAFHKSDVGPDYAIKIPLSPPATKIKIQGSVRAGGHPVRGDRAYVTGTNLLVTQSCYDSLDSTRQCAVIRGEEDASFDGIMSQELTLNDLSIILPDNQKPIICIDGYYLGALNVNDARLGTYFMNRTSDPDQSFRIGVSGCIGIRGLQGSNNGSETILQSTYAIGLGVGFALSGEHLVCIQLGAIGNRYGYTFNGFKHEQGVWCHPITLINCCDEVSANYPYFGPNEYHQNINLINFNIEHYPTMFSKGGDYAREAVPGQWGGNIDYDIQDWEYHVKNSPNRRFWAADSSGARVNTRNNAHSLSCTADELRQMAPNINQTVYSSAAAKPVMCRKAGDYARVRITFESINTRAGDIEIRVGATQRKVTLPRVFRGVGEMAEYIYRHLFYTTSVRLAEDKQSIDVWNCHMGIVSSVGDIKIDLAQTGIKAKVETVCEGADNLWIDMNGNPMP